MKQLNTFKSKCFLSHSYNHDNTPDTKHHGRKFPLRDNCITGKYTTTANMEKQFLLHNLGLKMRKTEQNKMCVKKVLKYLLGVEVVKVFPVLSSFLSAQNIIRAIFTICNTRNGIYFYTISIISRRMEAQNTAITLDRSFCIRIRTRGGIYGKIQLQGNPEGSGHILPCIPT